MTVVTRTEMRGAEIVRFLSDPVQIQALRAHVETLVNGEAFRASPRSQQFLRYIIDKSLKGDFDSLKERVIGVELFGRSTSFDTSEDSIVRVTASDVRKRLLQHYGRDGQASEIRLSIPSGSYIPEVTWHPSHAPSAVPADPAAQTKPQTIQVVEPRAEDRSSFHSVSSAPRFSFRSKLITCFVGLVLLGLIVRLRFYGPSQRTTSSVPSVLPWSALIRPGHTLQVIVSDPDFATEQQLTNQAASLADYANGDYLPASAHISQELREFCLKNLRGLKAADIDVPIAADISNLARTAGERVSIRTARALRLRDFHNDDDFVLLGSPLSNTWSELFTDQLDFRFILGNDATLDSIANVHPRGNELALYSRKAPAGLDSDPTTGTQFAIVAFVGNPNQAGQVLLIAGTGPEATEAASRLVTSIPDLSSALRGCNLKPGGSTQHFEMLLKIAAMNGSFSSTEVLACHVLSGRKS